MSKNKTTNTEYCLPKMYQKPGQAIISPSIQWQVQMHWESMNFKKLGRELDGLSRITEVSFLEFGQRIQSLQRQAKEVVCDAEGVIRQLCGEKDDALFRGVQLLSQRFELWLKTAEKNSSDICLLLNNLLDIIDPLETSMHGLKKAGRHVHSRRASTQTQKAKDYGCEPAELAKSFDEPGGILHNTMIGLNDQLAALLPIIKRSLAIEKAILEKSTRKNLDNVHSARKLMETSEPSVTKDQRENLFNAHSDAVNSHFSEFVTSLQFEDITHQRLGHAKQAVNQMVQYMERFSQQNDPGKNAKARHLFSCICQLQSQQLQQTSEEFFVAVDRLRTNLEGYSRNVGSMANHATKMFGTSDVRFENLYAALRLFLQSTTEHLEGASQIRHTANRNHREVIERLQKIKALVDQIALVSEEIQLVATRTRTTGGHLLPQQAGLDVISQDMQQVVEETSQHAFALAAKMSKTYTYLRQLKSCVEDNRAEASAARSLLQVARGWATVMESRYMQVHKMADKVDRDAGRFAREVTDVLTNFHIDSEFASKLKPIMGCFHNLGAYSNEESRLAEKASLESLFKDLELCYTMASEREVHRSFINNRPDSDLTKKETQNKSVKDNQHDLGDNVELF